MDIHTPVTIRVTARDILKGRRDSTTLCPIARAARRDLKMPLLGVIPEFICLESGFLFSLPPSAREFIQAFDAGGPVTPFQFEVSPLS